MGKITKIKNVVQAVILAAGEGTRLRPLTKKIPKVMIDILGKPLLFWSLSTLPSSISEYIIVVHYKKEQIMNYFGRKFNERKIIYIDQKRLLGTADAVLKARKHICTEKFLTVNGDDIIPKNCLQKLLQSPFGMLVADTKKPVLNGGSVLLDKKGMVKDIIDYAKRSHEISSYENVGNAFVLPKKYLATKPAFHRKYDKKEFGLPQTVIAYMRKSKKKLSAVQCDMYFRVNSIEDLKKVRSYKRLNELIL